MAQEEGEIGFRTGRGKARREAAEFEFGRSGTQEYNGYVTADYNPEFNGAAAVALCDKMRKTDGTVSAALKAVKFPIMASEWSVESADRADARQNEIAEFVRANLFDRVDFTAFLREALGYLDFGFWYFEKVYQFEGRNLVLKKLASRLPTAHECWEMRRTREPGVTQTLPSRKAGDPGTYQPEIPLAKLVVFTNEMEGESLAGTPLLRGAYKHYFMKDQLYRIDAVKHERGAGILKIRYPNPTDQAKADELGRNFNVNEMMYVAVPGPKPDQGQAGWDVEVMTAGIGDQSAALMESVRHHDRLILQSILASFLDLGAGKSGSFALGDVQQSFFGYALKSVAEYVASAINRQLIVELVDLNYGPQEAYPKLRAPRVGQMDQRQTADILNVLNTAGLLSKDPELMVWVSKAFGLPERTVEDFQADMDAREAAAEAAREALERAGKAKDAPEGEDDPQEGPKPREDAPKAPGKGGKLADARFRRPLTAAEGRVRLAEAKDAIAADRKRAKEAIAAMTDRQRQQLLERAAKVVSADDIDAVMALEVAGDPQYEAELLEIARKAMERGKLMAADEIGTKAPPTSSFARKAVKAKVALVVADRNAAIASGVKARLVDVLNGDAGKAAAVHDLGRVIDEAAARFEGPLVGQVTVEPLNEGRWLAFDDASEQIHAMQRTELLDERTCNVCLSLDGRVLRQTDPMTQIGEVHTNCDGFWVAILKTDADLPEPKPLPKSISSRFETVGGVPTTDDVEPMAKPVYTRDSRVARKVKDGELDVQ